jgi:hypothetical protein
MRSSRGFVAKSRRGGSSHVGVAESAIPGLGRVRVNELPKSAGKERFVPKSLIAMVATLCLCAPALLVPYGNGYDEGLALSAGTFIDHGLVPYRDFYWIYGPATGYLVATLMSLLGNSVEAFRVVWLVLAGLQALVAFQLIVRWTNPLAGIVLAVSAATIPVYLAGPGVSSWAIAMLAATAALLVAASRSTPRWRVVAGLLIGAACLLRLDVGAYVAIAAWIAYRDIRLALGAAILTVPAAVIALLAVPFDSLWSQAIWYPLVGLRQFRSFPLPNPLEAMTLTEGYFQAAVHFGVLVVLAAAWGWLLNHRSKPVLSLTVFATLAQLQALGRADLPHAAQAFTPAILLVSLWIPTAWNQARWRAIVAAALCAPLLTLPPTAGILVAMDRPTWDRSLDDAVAYTVATTRSSDPIFVGLTQNRYTLVNPMLAYFLADRVPATRFTMYNPGVTNTDTSQREMVDALRRTRAAVLILDRTWSERFEQDNDSRIAGSMILDTFIAENYEIALDSDEIIVMRLRSTSRVPVIERRLVRGG